MSAVATIAENPITTAQSKQAIQDNQPEILTSVYQENTNMVIWQRTLNSQLQQAVDEILLNRPTLKLSMVVAPQDTRAAIKEALCTSPSPATDILSDDITLLVDMFCCLFELNHAGLRITALDRAMCPKFHVDKVPCRLVSTYKGIATEWLPHHLANRSRLGAASIGKSDEQSGLYKHQTDIKQMTAGDVALLKGELWQNNEGAGLIHRSPQITSDNRRLILTLDFIND
ncbi:DUF1826 domain-containing protein [Catenovulum adriaticum]|uniref:DUF1826 domain-containing protein n=1 Tax=Catenovulum adriaticum TaxID=2984846 RepID=A0ABY7AJE9_9ALTE|nr:DUF1826 domain-containing protein [Catenovulum sp. TS8]WAJ69710.1 DUF1826 domain-containing protein [Catenovulum sp. TS8]